jgi:lipopolysaccharide export system permease protein
MNLYTKYIIKNLFYQFVAITLTLTIIVWITQSMRIVDLIVNKGISILDFLKITGLLLPYLIFIIMPASLFLAGIALIYKFSIDKELMILKNIGLSNFQIIHPILYFSVIITLLSYLISFYFLPLSYVKFKNLQMYFRSHYASILLEEGVFNAQVSNLTVFVDKKIDNNNYEGILVYDNRNLNKPKVIFAHRGRILNSTTDPSFELHNGTHQEKSIKNGNISLLYFDKYSLNLNILDSKNDRLIELNEKYITELFKISPEDQEKKNKLMAHGHFRISWPLYCISLILVGTTILVSNEYQRNERLNKIIFTLLLGLGIIVFSILFNNLALYNLYLSIFMYLTPILPIWFSIYFLKNS